MLLEDGLCDGQAEAGTLLASVRTGAIIPVKDIGQVVRRNARAVVGDLDPDALLVSEAFVDEGPTLKRFRPRAQGRAYRIRKRTCHITIAVEAVQVARPAKKAAAAKKAAPAKQAAPAKKAAAAKKAAPAKQAAPAAKAESQSSTEGAE